MKRAIAIFLICILCAASSPAQNDTRAPLIVLKDMEGKTVRLTDFKGKVVLLNFWATWCVPCAAEVPELIKWQENFKGDCLQIIGITYPPTNAAQVRRFVRKNKINYPVLFGSKATKKLFESTGILPVTVMIDRHGKVVGRIDGVIFEDEFNDKIKPLLISQ